MECDDYVIVTADRAGGVVEGFRGADEAENVSSLLG